MPAYDSGSFSPPAPVPRVTLRHQETGATLPDVPMLLDTGADVTLVPLAQANKLGVVIEEGDGYELLSFDGTKSIARAVRLDLLFLRRTFKGRFLVIDQECGILGRDILNHVRVLLDGPGLTWSEHL